LTKHLTIAELEDLRRFVAAETGSAEAALSAVLRAAQLGANERLERRAPDPILRATCEHFGITPTELVGPRRPANIANARMVAMHLLHASGIAYQEIADLLGRKGRSDVAYGIQRVEDDDYLRAQAAVVARSAEAEFVGGDVVPVILPRRQTA
jgi:chromosomal replication initiation ATPase DnaA